MMDSFYKETKEDLEFVHSRIDQNRNDVKLLEEKTTKEIREKINPIETEIAQVKETMRRPTIPSGENIQVIINPETLKTETEQKFYGDGRTNTKIFLKNLKNQVERVSQNTDLKNYLRFRFMGDAKLWYDIIAEDFETFQEFEKIFLQYYWGQQTQSKMRETTSIMDVTTKTMGPAENSIP